MRALVAMAGILALSPGTLAAQQAGQEHKSSTAVTNATALPTMAPAPVAIVEELKLAPSSTTRILSTVRVESPLIRPFTTRKASEVPKRVVQWVKPAGAGASEAERDYADRMENRAWSTIVGWAPGQSAFPDGTRHESQLRLITFSKARQR